MPLLDASAQAAEESGPFERVEATLPYQPVKLRPIAPVELARLAVELLGSNSIFMRRYPLARGAFYPEQPPRIGLNPELGKDYEQAAKTLAHEVGHLVDFLPEGTLKRGNILGRIASLIDYLKATIDAEPTVPSNALTPKDRRQIRRQAERAVGPKPKDKDELEIWQGEVATEYATLIQDEMDSRNLIGRDRVHEELLLLSEWWRPYDPEAVALSHKLYRQSSKELFADAVSVLLNSPGSLQARAPTFFDSFLAYMERKPEVKEAYEGIQALIGQGEDAIYAARSAEIQQGDFARGEQVQREAEERKDPQSLYSYLQQMWLSGASPVVGAEAKRVGKAVPAHSAQHALKMLLQEYRHGDNVDRLMLNDLTERVHRPLLQAGIAPGDAGEYLMLKRIAEGDRGGMAEQAREAIMDITGEQSWPAARKAYEALGEESEGFHPDLLATADSGVLNPHFYTPETAVETLEGLKRKLGPEKYDILERLMREYHELTFVPVEEGVRLGTIGSGVFESKLLPNKYYYAHYAVLDYFQGRVPAGIRQQIGTLKGIANPYATGIMKAMSLNRLNERQKAARRLADVLDVDFPGMAGPERVVDKSHREQRPGPKRANLHYFVDGRLHYREVDSYIAEVLEQHDIGSLRRLTELLSSKLYGFFHPLYVSWSVAWQARNIQRDWKRTYKNLAAAHAGQPSYRQAVEAILDIGRLNMAYAKTAPVAWANARRRIVLQLRAMLEDRALGRAFHSFDPNPQDQSLERTLQRFGILAPKGKGLTRTFEKLGSPIETLGVFQETWAKAAAYKLLGERGITGKERAYIVRNYTGTPDSTERGLAADVSNSLFMYSNVIIAGLRADAEVAFQPSTAAGYWFRSLITDFSFKALMAAGVLGYFGDDLKEWFARIPSYDLEKYIIVPVPPFWSVNKRGERKAIYLRLPHDDANRILAATTWALLTGNRPSAPTHAIGILAGEFPGLAPIVDLPLKTAQLATGRNPYDAFRGRNIVPRTQWDAGGWHRWKEMGRFAMGEFGVVSQILGHWTYASPDEGEAAPGEELLRAIPGLSSLVKISDRGLNESRFWEEDWDQRERARLRMDLSLEVRRATASRSQLNRFPRERQTDDEARRRELLNAWYRSYYLPLTAEMERARDANERQAYEQARERLNGSAAEVLR